MATTVSDFTELTGKRKNNIKQENTQTFNEKGTDYYGNIQQRTENTIEDRESAPKEVTN